MPFPPDVFSSAFYQPPPDQPPQVLPGFFSAFLATRIPWATTVFETRLRALDPNARRGYISGLVEQRTRLADAYRQAAADIDRRVSEGADRDVELRKVEASLLNSAVSAEADVFGARAGVREAEIRSAQLEGDALEIRNQTVGAVGTLEANIRRFADAEGRLPTVNELQERPDLLPGFQNTLQTQARALGQARLTDGQRVEIARDAENEANQLLSAINPALGALGVSTLRRTVGAAPTRGSQEGIGGVNIAPLRQAAEDARATRVGEAAAAGPRGTLTAGGGASSEARTTAAAGTPRQDTPELQELRRQIRAVDSLIDAAKAETLEEAFGLLGGFGEPLPGFGRSRERPSRQRVVPTARASPPVMEADRGQEPPPPARFPVRRPGAAPTGPFGPARSSAPEAASPATQRQSQSSGATGTDRQAQHLARARQAAADALRSPTRLRRGPLAAEAVAARAAPDFQGPTLAQRDAPPPARGREFVRQGPTLEQREAPTEAELAEQRRLREIEEERRRREGTPAGRREF